MSVAGLRRTIALAAIGLVLTLALPWFSAEDGAEYFRIAGWHTDGQFPWIVWLSFLAQSWAVASVWALRHLPWLPFMLAAAMGAFTVWELARDRQGAG